MLNVSFCSNERVQSINSDVKKDAPRFNVFESECSDQFLRKSLCSTFACMEKSYAGSILNDVKISERDQALLDTLLEEYQNIKREDFATQEEYEMAKDNAKKRYDDEVNRINEENEKKKNGKTNRFKEAMGAVGQFIKDGGKEIIQAIVGIFIPTP